MALPKSQPTLTPIRINSFTGEPLNTEVKENEIVDIEDLTRFKIRNNSGEELECFKVRGKNKDEYLVSLAFQNQIGHCNAIQYKRIQYPSLYLGEMLVESSGNIRDDGYTWVPIVKEFLND